jgi:hypothetical protein
MAGAGGRPEDGLPEDEPDMRTRDDGRDPDERLPEDAGGEAPIDAEDAIEESLQSALSDLERMLNRHEGGGSAAGGKPVATSPLDEDGEQYTIPLLDEVVIPGEPAAADAIAPAHPAPDEPFYDESEPALRARIAARLASEVDVIMQDRIEEALERAREDISRRVRDHMDIILPEIVEELMQVRRRDDGN